MAARRLLFLARAGQRVLVLEKDRFPRFHIGESLLPYNRLLFEEMGVLPTLEADRVFEKARSAIPFGQREQIAETGVQQRLYTRARPPRFRSSAPPSMICY